MFKGFINLYGGGIGSSYIAEAYWNFGYYSLFIMLIIGFIIGRLNKMFDKAVIENNYLKIFMTTYIFTIISFYVRSDTRTFCRNFVWFCVPMIIIYKYLKFRRSCLLDNNSIE